MKIVTNTKKFVVEHKVAITIVGTSIVWIALMNRATNQHDNFLKEKGLYEEFYCSDFDN